MGLNQDEKTKSLFDNFAVLLIAALLLNTVLLFSAAAKAFSSDISESLKDSIRTDRAASLEKISSQLVKLDENIKDLEKKIQKTIQNVGTPESLKNRFDSEMQSSIRLITERVTHLTTELNQVSKSILDLTVQSAELEERIRNKKK